MSSFRISGHDTQSPGAVDAVDGNAGSADQQSPTLSSHGGPLSGLSPRNVSVGSNAGNPLQPAHTTPPISHVFADARNRGANHPVSPGVFPGAVMDELVKAVCERERALKRDGTSPALTARLFHDSQVVVGMLQANMEVRLKELMAQQLMQQQQVFLQTLLTGVCVAHGQPAGPAGLREMNPVDRVDTAGMQEQLKVEPSASGDGSNAVDRQTGYPRRPALPPQSSQQSLPRQEPSQALLSGLYRTATLQENPPGNTPAALQPGQVKKKQGRRAKPVPRERQLFPVPRSNAQIRREAVLRAHELAQHPLPPALQYVLEQDARSFEMPRRKPGPFVPPVYREFGDGVSDSDSPTQVRAQPQGGVDSLRGEGGLGNFSPNEPVESPGREHNPPDPRLAHAIEEITKKHKSN